MRAIQDQLMQAMQQIETLREQNRHLLTEQTALRTQNLNLTAQLDEIHASRVWRYTESLRKS